MKVWLTLFVALMIWGPPRLRVEPRPLDVALSDPFNLDASALFQLFVWIGGAAVVAVLAGMANNRSVLPRTVTDSPTRWYLMYGALGLLSAVYSLGPLYTLYFAGKIIIAIITVAFLLHLQNAKSENPERAALNILFSVAILQASAIAVLYFVLPDLVGIVKLHGGYYRMQGGIFGDYGNSFLISGLFFLTTALFSAKPRRRAIAWVAYLVSLYFMSLSLTRSTNVAAFLIFFIMVLLQPKSDRKFVLTGLGVMAVLSVMVLGFGEAVVSFLSRNWEGVETLSRRTDAFSYLLGKWQDSPILGYGYAAGSRTLLMPFVYWANVAMGAGHDAVSTVLADLGLIGALILLSAFISAWREVFVLWRRTRNSPALYPVSLQLVCLMAWLSLKCVVGVAIAHVSMPFIVVMITARFINRRYEADAFRRSAGRDLVLEQSPGHA